MPGVRAEVFIFLFLKVLNNMAGRLVAPALLRRNSVKTEAWRWQEPATRDGGGSLLRGPRGAALRPFTPACRVVKLYVVTIPGLLLSWATPFREQTMV